MSHDQLIGTDQNRFGGGATLAPCPPPNQANNCENIARLNPNFGTINYVSNMNGGSYNAMILTLRGKLGSSLNFQGSYTLSRALSNINAGTRFDQDTSPVAYNVPDQNAYANYYGDANWDVRNRFSFSGVYNIPGFTNGFAKVLTSGWTLSSIIVAQSGTPFWVIDNRSLTAGGDYNADGIAYDVPNAPSFGCSGSYGRSDYINGLFTAANFSAPAPGTEGSEPRNCYRNPGLVNLDASVAKNTHIPHIGEAGNLQLRFDFLDLFNHGNLGPVDPLLGDGNFGKVTNALGARQIQLSAKISF